MSTSSGGVSVYLRGIAQTGWGAHQPQFRAGTYALMPLRGSVRFWFRANTVTGAERQDSRFLGWGWRRLKGLLSAWI